MVTVPYIIDPAASAAIDTESAKKHLRVFHNEEDTLINGMCKAADIEFAKDTGRVLITSVWEEAFTCWPGEYFELSRYPITALTSVTYTKSDGTTGTVSSSLYHLSTATRKPRVYLKYAQTWPTDTLQTGPSIRVRYTCGSATREDLDFDIRAALLVRIGDLYTDRDGKAEIRTPNPLIGSDRIWMKAVVANRIEP